MKKKNRYVSIFDHWVNYDKEYKNNLPDEAGI